MVDLTENKQEKLASLQIHIDNTSLDRDILHSVWALYMKVKYQGIYRLAYDDNGFWGIKSRYGIVTPYSLKQKLLMFYGNFETKNKKTYFKKKLPLFAVITQETDCEVIIKFPEDSLDAIEKLLFLLRPKVLSVEAREKLRLNMSNVRKMRKNETNTTKTSL